MKRMISTKAAETAEGIKDFVKQDDKTTEFGGNVKIGGNLNVNGKIYGISSLHVYKCRYKTTDTNVTFEFLWFTNDAYATETSIYSELIYKLSSGSGFNMAIPVVMDSAGYYNAVLAYGDSLKLYENGTSSHEVTYDSIYKIY